MVKPVQRKNSEGRKESPCSEQPQPGLAGAMKKHEGLVEGTREGIEQFEQGRFVKLTRTADERTR